MKALLVLSLLLGAPLAAQVVPDDFPDQTPMSDRVQRDLVERYRGFLSGLYSEGTLASGPVVGSPALYGSATVEGGYRFRSGDAVAVVSSFRAPLAIEPLANAAAGGVADELVGTVGVQGTLALRRFSDAGLARRAELGVGLGTSFFGSATVVAVEALPRVAIPLSPTTSLPVGLRISQQVAGPGVRGPYVGLSVGLRRIWADEARMVLE